jgi:Uncharacterised protein family (UPF0164)
MKKLLVVLFLIISTSCFADFSSFYSSATSLFSIDPNTGLTTLPILLIPVGGKYEGMGTAYTAYANDSTAIEINPAVSAVLPFTELGFIHHDWISDSNFEGLLYTMRLGDWGFGATAKVLYVPFTSYNDWGAAQASGYYSEGVLTLNTAYNFFSSYSFFGVALGVNGKLAYRYIPQSVAEGQSTIAGVFDVGLLTRFNLFKFYNSTDKNFSVGLTVKNLGFTSLQENLPTMTTVGLAYSPIRPLTFDVDLNYPFTLNSDYPATVPYFAFGADVEVAPFVSLQTGFRVTGGDPFITLGTMVNVSIISFDINYNVDLASQGPFDQFSVEAKFRLGDFGRAALREKADELYLEGVEAYANGDSAKAIELWTEVLSIYPKYDPAKQNIEVVLKSLELQKQMQSEEPG